MKRAASRWTGRDTGGVTLNLDMSTPIRSPARYRELVTAIYRAPASTQETNAVEWKGEANLAEKRWQAEMGRQILGMANRDPDVAAKVLGGCAYILLGVSPGGLVGTPVHDTAKLESWISPYVGQPPNAPEWAPTYVRVEDKDVLVLAVEPARWGHPAWPCRKEYSPGPKQAVREGAVYVRHKASTREATAADIEMLSRRAGAARRRVSGISLALETDSRAVAIDAGPEALAAWGERERETLKPPPPAPPAPRKTIQVDAANELGLKAMGGLFANLDESVGKTFREADARTPETYQKEVDAYIARATEALPAVLLGRAYRAGLGRVSVLMRNDSEDPVRQLQVEIYLTGSGFIAMDEGDIPMADLPKRPIVLGKGGRNRLDALAGAGLRGLTIPRYDYIGPAIRAVRRSVRIDNSGSVRLTFDPLDLYPEEIARLEEVWLFTSPSLAGTTLVAEWSARSRDASGVMRDTLEIEVDPGVRTIDELLAVALEPPADDEEDG